MNDTTKAWILLADKDVKAAEKLLEEAYLYNLVLFHAQQAIEKVLKSVLEENAIAIPKVHDLNKIYELIPEIIRITLAINLDELDKISDIYIDSRYPTEIGLLPSGEPTKQETEEILEISKEIVNKVVKYLEEKE